MTNATRIYRVADGDNVRLVDAATAAQAIRHVAAQRYNVSIAKPKDVAYLCGKGVKVETARDSAIDGEEAAARR